MPQLKLTPAENEYLATVNAACEAVRDKANRMITSAHERMGHCLLLIAKSHGLPDGLPVEAELIEHEGGSRSFVWADPVPPVPAPAPPSKPSGKKAKPKAKKTVRKKKPAKKRPHPRKKR